MIERKKRTTTDAIITNEEITACRRDAYVVMDANYSAAESQAMSDRSPT